MDEHVPFRYDGDSSLNGYVKMNKLIWQYWVINYHFRMQEEVDEVVGKKSHISFEDVAKLEYMSLVWKETLRMYAIVPVSFRDIDRDDYKIQGYDIPRDSIVMVSGFLFMIGKIIYNGILMLIVNAHCCFFTRCLLIVAGMLTFSKICFPISKIRTVHCTSCAAQLHMVLL